MEYATEDTALGKRVHIDASFRCIQITNIPYDISIISDVMGLYTNGMSPDAIARYRHGTDIPDGVVNRLLKRYAKTDVYIHNIEFSNLCYKVHEDEFKQDIRGKEMWAFDIMAGKTRVLMA